MKPREWKIFGIACAEKGSAAYDNFQWNEGAVHAIEKSAYDRLEAMTEKLAEALGGAVRFGREMCEDVNVSTHQYSLERGAEALAEYRAMRDETKMPCPDKDIDPFG